MAPNGPLWCWSCWWPGWMLLVRWSCCCWCCQWWFRPEQLSLIYHLHTNARENSPNVAKIMEAVDERGNLVSIAERNPARNSINALCRPMRYIGPTWTVPAPSFALIKSLCGRFGKWLKSPHQLSAQLLRAPPFLCTPLESFFCGPIVVALQIAIVFYSGFSPKNSTQFLRQVVYPYFQ